MMPSPFPGMDPYLERPSLWPDVHIHLISAISAELNAVLPLRYAAVADMHVWIPKFLEIIELEGDEVVTVMELLSPTNKRAGTERDAYLTKRAEYVHSSVNVVEIDLLRGGTRPPVEQPTRPNTDYCITVCRAVALPRVDLWPFSIREEIPSVCIPLRGHQDEPQLNLRRCLDRVYDEHRFRQRAHYDREPIPPIRESDRDWVQSIIQAIPPANI
jgi:hypothetical protein